MIPTVRYYNIVSLKIVIFSIASILISVAVVNVSAASLPHPNGRIIGGTNVSILQFPYQASIRRRGAHICGGSIFHYFHVLSAAHCATGGSISMYSVRVGTEIVNDGGTIVSVCSIKLHEKFRLMTMEGDIAIFTLCTPLTFSEKVLPVALPNPWESVKPGTEALVSGWGYVQPEGGPTSRLQAIKIPIISVEACDKLYGEIGVTNTMICAGYVGRGEKDACQGDSGGPLLADGKLFGIVSWGYGCADPNFPGVYTNVAKYRAWIRQTTYY